MRIGILVDHLSELYCRQRLDTSSHNYHIYRNQLAQYSHQTTNDHYLQISEQGILYLIEQGVDYIICPPVIELYYHHKYQCIYPLFQSYLTYCMKYSIVGKLGFIGSQVQCEIINQLRKTHQPNHIPTTYQQHNHHFKSEFPIRTVSDQIIPHLLAIYPTTHPSINTTIKQHLKKLKDAAVDTVVGLNWSYFSCDRCFNHHVRHIRWHRRHIMQQITQQIQGIQHHEGGYQLTIHHTGTLRDIKQHKKLRRLLSKGNQVSVQSIQL